MHVILVKGRTFNFSQYQFNRNLCTECVANGTACMGCDNVAWSGATIDVCHICGGNGTSCLGCDGVAFSNVTVDQCGTCGGNDACTKGEVVAKKSNKLLIEGTTLYGVIGGAGALFIIIVIVAIVCIVKRRKSKSKNYNDSTNSIEMRGNQTVYGSMDAQNHCSMYAPMSTTPIDANLTRKASLSNLLSVVKYN